MIPKFEEETDEMDQVFENPMDVKVMNEYLMNLSGSEGASELFDRLCNLLDGYDADQALHTIATLLVAYGPADPEISEMSKSMGIGDIEVSLADRMAQDIFNALTIDMYASPRVIFCIAAKLIAFTVARKRFLIDKFGPLD